MEWCGEQTHITSLGPNVWIGDSARPAAEQGRTVLGAPVGTDDSVQTQIATGIGKPIVTPLLQRLLHRPPSILYFCSTQQTQKQLLPMPPEHTRENTTWQSPVASQIFCKHPPYSQKHSPQHICRLLRGIKAHTSMPLSHTAPPPPHCKHQTSTTQMRAPMAIQAGSSAAKYYKTEPGHPGNNIIGAEGISTCQEPYARAGCQLSTCRT